MQHNRRATPLGMLAVTTAAMMLLTGCAAAGTPAAAVHHTKTGTPTPTPVPTYTPAVMTDLIAGRVYLADICQSNKAGSAFNSALDTNDVPTINVAAALARDADSSVASKLDKALWPDDVKTDIALVRDNLFADASNLSSWATASSIEQMNGIAVVLDNGSGAASQRIRARLNLPSDPMAGC
jgi:hypothetical protein